MLEELTPAEIKRLTKRRARTDQVAELINLGIPHRIRRDKSILVLRIAVERLLGGLSFDKVPATVGDSQPDWGNMRCVNS